MEKCTMEATSKRLPKMPRMSRLENSLKKGLCCHQQELSLILFFQTIPSARPNVIMKIYERERILNRKLAKIWPGRL